MEGRLVKEGEILYVIQHDDLQASYELLTDELRLIQNSILNEQTYIKSIKKRKNLFESDNPMETKYYYAFSNFMNECRNASQQLNLNETQLFETKEQLQRKLKVNSRH